jgi:hypothetical protein
LLAELGFDRGEMLSTVMAIVVLCDLFQHQAADSAAKPFEKAAFGGRCQIAKESRYLCRLHS